MPLASLWESTSGNSGKSPAGRVFLLVYLPTQFGSFSASVALAGPQCAAVADAGAVPALLSLLSSPRPTTQLAALEALAALVGGSGDSARSGSSGGGAGSSSRAQGPVPLQLAQLLDALPSLPSEQQQQQPVQQQSPLLNQLLALLRQNPSPATRFRVAVVVAGLLRAVAAAAPAAPSEPAASPVAASGTQQEQQAQGPGQPLQQLREASRVVLPGLVKLLQQAIAQGDCWGSGDSGRANGAGVGTGVGVLQPQVAPAPWLASSRGSDCVAAVLADLMANDDDLIKAALDADAVKLLCSCLAASTAASTPAQEAACGLGGAAGAGGASGKAAGAAGRRMRAGALRALGALCMRHEEARVQVVTAKAVPHITAALSDPDDGARAAAALCIRGLSNSARSLRISFVDAGIAAPLVKLLGDDSTEVQVGAGFMRVWYKEWVFGGVAAPLVNLAVGRLHGGTGELKVWNCGKGMHGCLWGGGGVEGLSVWQLAALGIMGRCSLLPCWCLRGCGCIMPDGFSVYSTPPHHPAAHPPTIIRPPPETSAVTPAHIPTLNGLLPLPFLPPFLPPSPPSPITRCQVSAASAICNLVLDFRSIRQAVLQAGALKLLMPLAGSMVAELRACAVKALKNLTIKTEDAATRQVCVGGGRVSCSTSDEGPTRV